MIKTIIEVLQGKENIVEYSIQPNTITCTLSKPCETDALKQVDGVKEVYVDGNTIQILLEQPSAQWSQEFESEMTKKEPMSWRRILNGILDALSGSLVPLIPMLISAAMFKTVASILGPSMLGLITENSDLYKLFNFVGDAGFYFFPIVVGYTAAKTFKVTPVLGMFLGAILVHPTLIEMAEHKTVLSVYGFPAVTQNYASTIIPTILSVWVMSYVEHFFQKWIPEALQIVFVPFLTIAVMLPLTLCLLGPAGSFIGNGLCNVLLDLGSRGGIITVLTIVVLGALWQFIIMGGLHWLFISSIFVVLSQSGQESIVTAICGASAFSVGGMCMGMLLRLKNKEERSLAISCLISQAIGGVTEPGIYGMGIKYRTPLAGMVAGGAIGGLYAALFGLTAYNFMPVASFLLIFNYVGGTTANFIHGIVACIIGFVVSTVVTFITYKEG